MQMQCDSPSPSSDNNAVSDVDYRLIGLSPQYWAYTPLLIGDLIRLPLINGVDCFIAPYRKGNDALHNSNGCVKENGQTMSVDEDDSFYECIPDQRASKSNGFRSKSWQILPLSRILLRGIATAIDKRPNGCTLIVLDDGTGSIDCRCWDDTHNGNSAFNLPSSFPEHEQMNKCRGFRFAVGDFLEVMGKMKALTAGNTNCTERCKLLSTFGIPLEVRLGCVREVHATSVCVIGEGQMRMANKWNGEVVHWLKCMDFSNNSATQFDEVENAKGNTPATRNGKDVSALLGKTISSSILDGRSSDLSELWKVRSNNNFLERKCCQTSLRFRNAFFYCHCEATWEALDPCFRFRDALLNRLLDMEAELRHSSDSAHPFATEDCMDLCGVQSDSMPPPLLFTFESIYKDEALKTIASEIVASKNLSDASTQRLVRKTFAAMINDGILSLYNAEEDLYLLVSRTRLVELLRRGSKKGVDQPFFIKRVPKKKLAEIRY